jgi:hypothetical protein
MRYLLIAFLAVAGVSRAQAYDRDDGDGWRRRDRVHCCRRDDDGRDTVRRHYRHHRRFESGDEDRGWRRDEGYRGWWYPEGRQARGWREFVIRNGVMRCRPPMHAAGDADARSEAARNMAIKAWQEQVINEHGERFINFAAAYILDEHCDPARVGENNLLDLKRCVITAAPCLTPLSAEERRREEDRERREREEERPREEHR